MSDYRSPRRESESAAPSQERGGVREILSAWVIAALLLLGAIVSVTLDHMITVSSDPPATYSAVREEIEAGEGLSADPVADDRERRDEGAP
jgi:hypothetical protein